MVSSSAIAASKSLMVVSICFGDVAVQFTLREGNANLIAGFCFRRSTDRMRYRFIPYDGIPSAENGKRTQTVEPCSAGVKARLRAMMALSHRCAHASLDSNQFRS